MLTAESRKGLFVMLENEGTELRKKIVKAESDLKSLKFGLEKLERECRHSWGETISDDIVRPAGHCEGDPLGTMGVDRRLPFDYPEQRTPRWKRTCQNCGKVEYTRHSKPTGAVTPIF